MRTTPSPIGSTTSSLQGRCCRNEHAFHTVSSSPGYCENSEMTAPLLVVDVSMQSTVPTRPLWTLLYSSAMFLLMINLLLFLQKQKLATAIYLFGLGTLLLTSRRTTSSLKS